MSVSLSVCPLARRKYCIGHRSRLKQQERKQGRWTSLQAEPNRASPGMESPFGYFPLENAEFPAGARARAMGIPRYITDRLLCG